MRRKNSDRDQAKKLTQYLEENISKDITMQEIADYMHMSPSMLYRFSRDLYGHAVMEELTSIRMRKARALLETNLPVLDIAFACGYSNPASFGRKFREYFCASPSAVRAQMNRTRTRRTVDVEKRTALHNPWKLMINAGSFEMLLDQSARAQILLLHEDLHIPYLRLWNIFSDWLLLSDKNDEVKIRYSYLDEMLDFLHSHQIRPFIDLGIKPVQVIKDYADLVYDYHQMVKTHMDYARWERLIQNFINHIVARYGQEEVSKWMFEVHQNPQSFDEDKAEEFFAFYDRIIAFLKEKLPAVQIGGCGWWASFPMRLEHISRMRNKPDFVSLYFYCLSEGIHNQEIHDLAKWIQAWRDMLENAGLNNMKIILSEWNTEIMNARAYNDGTRKAVDLLKLTTSNLDSVAMGSYFCLGDLIKDSDGEDLFNGGLGLLTKDGIKKPAYFAYQYLCKLGTELIERGENYIVTKQDRAFQILAWQEERSGSNGNGEERTRLDLTLEHLPNGTYLERRYQSGDSMEQFQLCRATIGNHPELQNKAALRYLAHPSTSVAIRTCRKNRLTVTVECSQNQFCFFELISV